MPDLPPFVDELQALSELYADLVPDGHVVRWTGTNLQQLLADGEVIRVARIGGDDDRFTAVPRVDVSVFGLDIVSVRATAERARQRLLSYPHATSYGVIDRAATEVAPHEVPYDDPDVRDVTATYRISTRRHRAA